MNSQENKLTEIVAMNITSDNEHYTNPAVQNVKLKINLISVISLEVETTNLFISNSKEKSRNIILSRKSKQRRELGSESNRMGVDSSSDNIAS